MMTKGELTRFNILNKAYELIYRKGYQSTSIDEIIASTAVTKGSLYHHFKNKDEMGMAIIKEILYPRSYDLMIRPLLLSKDPRKDIYKMMEHLLIHHSFFDVRYGCPAVNLVEEMAPLDAKFNDALNKMVMDWKDAIENCIERCKVTEGTNNKINSKQVAVFIISGYFGVRNIGKVMGPVSYRFYLKELKNYLKNLN